MPYIRGTSHYSSYVEPVIKNKLVKSYAPYVFNMIAIIVLILFALRPTILTISTLQKNIAQNQQLLQSIQDKSKQIEQGRDTLQSLSPETKDKIKQAVPTHPEVTALINSLRSSITSQASVSALQIQPVTLAVFPESTAGTLTPAKIQFNFNIQGTYPQALSTVQNLFKSSRVLSIDTVTISKQEKDPLVLSVAGTATYLK